MKRQLVHLVLGVTFASASGAAAQPVDASHQRASTDDESDDSGWMALARRWFDSDDTVPRFTIVFGGIKAGSGAALGPAVAYSFGDGSFVQAQAEYSIHHYKLLQTRFQSRSYGFMGAVISARVRWQDAPRLALYELGADSPNARALYGERKTEYSAAVMLSPTTLTRVSGGLGYERFTEDDGRLDLSEDEHLSIVPRLPGIGQQPHFVHAFAAAGVDTRPSGDASRRGSRANAAIHRFIDRSDTGFSFSQFVLEAEHLIPVAHEHGALSLAGNLWTTTGANVPFFLMPTLGGGDYLRGYRTYRFRDRDAAVVTAQFQWGVHQYADAVAFVDAGIVAPRLSAIRPSAIPVTQGIGVRVHTPKKTVFRLDLARSVEGFQLLIGFSARASAVF
jgi:hypothetical protein